MPSVQVTYSFDADLENWILSTPSTAGASLVWESSDGSPSNGCMKLLITAVPGASTQGMEAPLQTWEQLGVPPTAEVLTVQLAGFNASVVDDTPGQTIRATILDSSDTDILDGDLFLTTALPSPSAWTPMGAGPLRNVDFLAQESTEQVKLQLEIGRSANGSLDFRFDTIVLTITYDDGSGGSSVTPISNLDGLVFMKGFAYASRIGGTPDAVGMAALQECSISHSYSGVEANGPESLQPLAYGITGEQLTGTIRHLVCTAEQFVVFMGGSMAYNGGTGKTTYTKKVNEEPSGFNLHLKTPDDGSDLEIYVYNCLATNQPVIEGGANREFKVFGVEWRAFGQTAAQGSKLMDIIFPGNQTAAS